MKLKGFGLFVNCLDDMVCFYNEVLDFDIEYDPEDNYASLEKDGVVFTMHLRTSFKGLVDQKLSEGKGISSRFEIILDVEDFQKVDDTFEYVVAKGAMPLMEPKTMPWGKRVSYIYDPEGNIIELSSSVQGDFVEEEIV